MANSFAASRAQLIFALCLPVAVLLGYMLAEPMNLSSLTVVMLVFGVLSVPILMHWYHPLLILTWNAAITPFFLPGQPFVWMLFAFLGFIFAVINRFTSTDARFVVIPSIIKPLVALLIVVMLTAFMHGGFGVRVFGSGQHGGKGYFYVLASILGYFVLTSKRIPANRATILAALFFLSGITSLIPNVAYLLGPSFEFLFYLFPPAYAYEQALGDYNVNAEFSRVYGLTFGANAVYCWVLARYGLEGVFDLRRPMRMVVFLIGALGSLFCGFRGFMVLFLLTIVAQFFAEKLYRPRVLMSLAACFLVLGALAFPLAERLPLVVQRSLSFLPLPINPAIRANAESSSEWRLQMWQDVLPDIPKYFFKGKGYNLNPNELEMAIEDSRRGYFGRPYAWALLTGAYHNGPLTLLIPFGFFGFAAFVWFTAASFKYLYRNFKRGPAELQTLNTFLFAYFIARLAYFTFIFGNFYSDVFEFTGIIGLSVSINGQPVSEPETDAEEVEAAHAEEFGTITERL